MVKFQPQQPLGDFYLPNYSGIPKWDLGSFSSNATQTFAIATNAYAITYTDTEISRGVSLSNNSRINISRGGVYLITFSACTSAASPADHINIWLSVNGVNVPRSNTLVELPISGEGLMTVTYLYEFQDKDYFELYANGDTNMTLKATAAGANPTRPASPSIIVTVNRVA